MLTRLGKEPGPDPNADGAAHEAWLESTARSRRRLPVDRPHIRRRLEANPRTGLRRTARHVPILILVELKDDAIPGLPTRPVRFGRDQIETVDAEILSVFAKTEILTPDRVRGRFATLPEAIRAQGWPALERGPRPGPVRARQRRAQSRPLSSKDTPRSKTGVMFVTVAPEHPAAAWFKVNDPIKDFDKIQRLVKAAFWSARGPMPTRARPAQTTSASATRPWPAGPSISAPTTPSPIDGFPTIPCVSPRPGGPVQPRERRPGLGPDRPGKRRDKAVSK